MQRCGSLGLTAEDPLMKTSFLRVSISIERSIQRTCSRVIPSRGVHLPLNLALSECGASHPSSRSFRRRMVDESPALPH